MRAAKERPSNPLSKPVLAEALDIKAKFSAIQAEVSAYRALSVENGKLEEELARLRQENEELQAKVSSQQELVQQAVDAAREEAVGPLRQQLEELDMQLQNSQIQLERLGEAVEVAENEKAEAIKTLKSENTQLLGALSGAASRLTEAVFPPGALPGGLTISTSLGGTLHPDTAASGAIPPQQPPTTTPQQQEQQPLTAPTPAPAAAAPAAAEPPPQQAPAPTATAPSPQQPLGGVFSRLVGLLAFWLYQLLGAALLYYAAAVLRGAPPALNLEFGLGCWVVCTLLPWANRLLVPRRAA
ncbi:hypothetical protein TSOC_006842 [Tetrabaena socialis]|uniref:Uncharacterized protein n=1 Tax=Tetrabaena socialis TaxID=47790 RepID=A0A2J8A2M6_9CHLO|nr:hypothetical protein TSOC_006842 [Tetrabaena socialis]|eukprot:PNH06763.1 hypothetical protein TSOC_006842 [Tetrabaena socialis]